MSEASPIAFEASAQTGLSLPRIVGILFRRKLAIGALSALAAVVSLLMTIQKPTTYSVVVMFTPERAQASRGLGGALGLVGLGADPSQSPAFYVDLLQSRGILRKVATAEYTLPMKPGTVSGTLPVVLGLPMPGSPDAIDAAIRTLAGAIRPGVSGQTGVVRVTVTTRSPHLSAQIASHLLEAVNMFNQEVQRQKAGQQKTFTGQRVAEFRNELALAESRLQEFLQRNRDFATSSQAALERERLSREVSLRQQMYITLTEAFEQARMEEMRSAAQITVIQRAEVPIRRDPKGRLSKALLGALFGALVGISAVLLREVLRQARDSNAGWYLEWIEGLRKTRA